MKIVGITKVRNEEEIIEDTLDHFLGFCDRIYVFDDASTDRTPEICDLHVNVEVQRGLEWNPNRFEAERDCRQKALEMAQKDDPDWIIQFDADERIEMPAGWEQYDAVRMKLFDFYITPEDVHLDYTHRRWMGPEFRAIIMMYRNGPHVRFEHLDQREMRLPGARILDAGFVKHYGKAISVQQWEDTCEYYATHFPEPYRTKWDLRRGKAVHSDYMSDFGRPLVTWDQRIGGVRI